MTEPLWRLLRHNVSMWHSKDLISVRFPPPPHPPVRPHVNPSSSLCSTHSRLVCTTLANLNKEDFSHCWFSRPSKCGSVSPQSNILAVETAAGPAPPPPPYTDLVNTTSLLYKHSQQRSNSFVAEVRMAGVRNAKVTAGFSPLPLTLSSPIEGCLGLICGGFVVTLVLALLMKGRRTNHYFCFE